MRTTTAIVLEVVFAVLAFGVRTWVQWRRTGSTGLVLPRRGAPPVERLGAGLFVLAIVLLVVAPIAAASGLDPWPPLDNAAGFTVGALLAVAGIVLCVAAQLTMGDSWRIGVDQAETTQLVTSGVFASVRNPIFSAMALAAAGFALLLANLWALAALVALLVGLELQVRFVEEPYLRRTHGRTYDSYAAQAGRFIPSVGSEGSRR
ncbi:MAG TPA: isoprenylcysteine carboxylmethyltransferase family protein [Acidimicrobiales bacterium]